MKKAWGWQLYATSLFLVLAGCAVTAPAPAANPADGLTWSEGPGDMSYSRLDQMTSFFADRVNSGETAGFVIIVARHGKIVLENAYGARDLQTGAAMQMDTKFRIASMTKPVTAVAVLSLLEQGKLALNDPVKNYLPEISQMQVRNPDGSKSPAKRDMTIRDLFTHTSGIGYRFDPVSDLGKAYIEAAPYQKASSLEDAVRIIAAQDLYFTPGEKFLYSYSTDILGRVVEVVSGENFSDYTERVIFKPLGMHDTGFTIPAADKDRLATVYAKAPDQSLKPVPGDLFGNPFDAKTWPSGGAGLISTAPDYMRFAMMLGNQGSLDGVQILSPASVELMGSDHLPKAVQEQLEMSSLAGVGMGLSVAVIKDAARTGRLGASGDVAWGGHYDTQFFVSPRYGIAAVFMTQLQPHPDAAPTDTMALFKTQVLASVKN